LQSFAEVSGIAEELTEILPDDLIKLVNRAIA
jgi:hypothetical protein